MGAAAQIGVLLKKIAKSERLLVFWLVVFSGVISGFKRNFELSDNYNADSRNPRYSRVCRCQS